jgi:hypothetical protein
MENTDMDLETVALKIQKMEAQVNGLHIDSVTVNDVRETEDKYLCTVVMFVDNVNKIYPKSEYLKRDIEYL